ncbi:MAG: flagellar assembly peptidoglycan hydrolase FlgJ [Stagnimonas sp.]|nr:flagellar assembly peptidoglycan hydrolase FlgJ [Stagnimonas sp.]
MNNIDAGNALSGSALAGLRRDAATSPQDDATIRKVAQQFEALLTQQVLKSSRATALGDDLMGGSGLDLYKDMFDQQMAQQISAKGLGLADVLVQQLRGSKVPSAPTLDTKVPSAITHMSAAAATPVSTLPITDRITSFVKNIWQQAETAANALGLPTEAVVGHAALETGWGAHQPGGGSNNLFGIKADSRWQGDKVTAKTTEMDGGTTRTEQAQFRAYDSSADGFADYVRFLKGNPRYAEAIKAGGSVQQFAQGLQKAGYATDPQYAEKLTAAVARVAKSRDAASVSSRNTF